MTDQRAEEAARGGDPMLAQMLAASRSDAADREAARGRLAETSRSRLLAIAEKKVRTAFIGALAAFEEEFGRLWGHGQPPGGRTAGQAEMGAYWDAVRARVLDQGNGQIRALRAELELYEVVWKGYHADVTPRG